MDIDEFQKRKDSASEHFPLPYTTIPSAAPIPGIYAKTEPMGSGPRMPIPQDQQTAKGPTPEERRAEHEKFCKEAKEEKEAKEKKEAAAKRAMAPATRTVKDLAYYLSHPHDIPAAPPTLYESPKEIMYPDIQPSEDSEGQ